MNYKLLFFDTETTGRNGEDRLCQIAYICEDKSANEMFKPPKPIELGAMAIHHITNKMVADKPAFEYSALHKDLHDRAHDDSTIFVAHNAQFDLDVIKYEGIIPKKSICTLKVIRSLDESSKIESYKLQYLRYYFGLEVEANAHDAMGDVIVLQKVYEKIFEMVKEKHKCDDNVAIELMMEISSKPSLLNNINFGKHRGKTVAEVAKTDRGYLEWLYNEKKKDPSREADWLYTLEHYLK